MTHTHTHQLNLLAKPLLLLSSTAVSLPALADIAATFPALPALPTTMHSCINLELS